MAGVSVAELVLFIASLMVATAVAGTLTSNVQRLAGAVDDQGFDVREDVRTDVEIIGDAGSTVFDTNGNGNVTLFVKNTGSETLPTDPDGIDLLVDGEFQTGMTITVVDGTEWTPGNVAQINVTSVSSLSDGDHRVKVIVNEDEEVFRFRV